MIPKQPVNIQVASKAGRDDSRLRGEPASDTGVSVTRRRR